MFFEEADPETARAEFSQAPNQHSADPKTPIKRFRPLLALLANYFNRNADFNTTQVVKVRNTSVAM